MSIGVLIEGSSDVSFTDCDIMAEQPMVVRNSTRITSIRTKLHQAPAPSRSSVSIAKGALKGSVSAVAVASGIKNILFG
ncbi:hypothetical protein [Paracoccus albicereus]|uniref:hypothetical protein n=1 Tax=Paracoccus albicereus TaxID=2922394 RepID=UPI00210099B4|nr:hypothetical protein [Paracoccus albicereus]